MSVTYTSTYTTAWYGGTAVADASVVPGRYMVAINGRPYMLNTDPQAIEDYGSGFKEESLPLLRAQADQAKTPAEQSLSPTQFWRRGQETWHKGAGQSVLDRETSDPARFNTSKGVDPWTRYQLSLQRLTYQQRSSANTNLYLTTGAGPRYYMADGQSLYTNTSLGSPVSPPTVVTGTPAANVTGLATNGNTVYAAHGASGIYTVTGTTAASYATGTVDSVGYAKGRLLASSGQNLYNVIAAGALPAALFAHPDTGWVWRAYAEGNTCIYAAGDAGDRSRIYRVGIDETTGTLGVAIVAATLPTGEIVRSLLGYMGFVIIGTDRGVRFATAESSGDLTLGALIPTPAAVQALNARDQFVWFGWSNYDASNTGLGRLDLTTINEGLAPAYASDLMITGAGAVMGIVNIGTRTAFTVAGRGLYSESADEYVPSGTLTSGQITYGIADPKVAVQIDLKHAKLSLNTSVSVGASYDRATTVTLGTSSAFGTVSPAKLISAGKARNEEAELTLTLATTSSPYTPVLTRWTLMSYPAPSGASIYTLPLLLHDRVVTLRDTEEAFDPLTEYQYLIAVHGDREIVTVQVGADAFEGVIEDYIWLPNAARFRREFFNGTFIAKIRRIAG